MISPPRRLGTALASAGPVHSRACVWGRPDAGAGDTLTAVTAPPESGCENQHITLSSRSPRIYSLQNEDGEICLILSLHRIFFFLKKDICPDEERYVLKSDSLKISISRAFPASDGL